MVVLAALVLGVRPRAVGLACVAAATVGTLLTVGPVQSGQVVGVLLGLGAALSYAVYVVGSSQVAAGAGPLGTAAVVMGACAVVYDVAALTTRAAVPHSAPGWLALLGVALIGTVVAVSAFFAALTRLGPSDTAVVSTVEPVVSIGVAALVLGERLSPLQVAGGVLVLAAVTALAQVRPVAALDEETVPA